MYMYILGIPGTLPCRLSVNRTVVPTLYICVVVKNVLKKKKQHTNKNYCTLVLTTI